jgi:hypothetical protein
MWINGFWQEGFWVSGFWEGDALPPEVGGDLSPLAIAVQGIGFTPVHVALQGIYGEEVTPPATGTGGGRPHRRPVVWIPYHAIPKRRSRHRRQDDILFLRA